MRRPASGLILLPAGVVAYPVVKLDAVVLAVARLAP